MPNQQQEQGVETAKLEREFRAAVSAWRKGAIHLEMLLSDSDDISEIKFGRDILEKEMDSLTTALMSIENYMPAVEQIKKYEDIEEDNHQLVRRACLRIISLEVERSEIRSSTSTKTQHSHISSSSGKYTNVSRKNASSTSTTIHVKTEETSKNDSKPISQEISEAQSILVVEPETDRASYVSEYLDRNYQLMAPAQANDSMPALDNSQTASSQIRKTTNPGVESGHEVSQLAECLAKHLAISRLPPPEPGIFTGDPLQYANWKVTFETLIEKRGIPPAEQLHYLKKYVGGPAKQALEGYFYLTTDDAFVQAKKLLQERYGNPFVIATAFRNKLDSWPAIPPKDGTALRQLADFMRQCVAAMENIGNLGVLNDERENRKLLAKLPDWLITRWARKASEHKEEHKEYPSFKSFAKFIEKEAIIACDPVTSLQGLKGQIKSTHQEKRPKFANTMTTSATEYNNRTCVLCEKSHQLDMCHSFSSMPMNDRKEFIKRKGLCFGCLQRGHVSKNCRKRSVCRTCSKHHPTSLHGDYNTSTPKKNSKTLEYPPVQTAHRAVNSKVSMFDGLDDCVKSSMTVPVWVSHRDNPAAETLVYALLDTQSDTTFILDSTCATLGVKGPEVQLLLSTMLAEDQRISSNKISGLMVRGFNSNFQIPLPATFTREVMPANRSHIPTPDMARKWPHLEVIADTLMKPKNCDIGLLIGYNCPKALAPREVIPPSGNGPYAQRTDLGWGIVGIVDGISRNEASDVVGVSHRIMTIEAPTPPNIQVSFRTRVKEVINPSHVCKMMELDFSERAADEKSLSLEDTEFLTTMNKEIRQLPDGHFTMPLPFKGNKPPLLPNNKSLALCRLNQLKSRLKRNPTYYDDYRTFMTNIIENGHAVEVPNHEAVAKNTWYVPHHGVYHSKKPGKLRVVFDCSARFQGHSLNDHLLQGPDLTNNLVGVLLRFRSDYIAITCDIEAMFHQFKVERKHQDFLRFLWWKGGDYDNGVIEYRMNVHIFGAVSSPGCANFGLKKIADTFESEYGPTAANYVRRNFYVDDGLMSVSTVNEAIRIINQTKALCASGGLRLHKFASNSRLVLDSVAVEDRAKGLTNLDLSRDTLPIERALGVQWCIDSDTFQFRIVLKDQPLTRRGVLSTICSVYDPLGFVAPTVLVGKRILQNLCREQAGWDEPLPDSIRTQWERWRRDLHLLENLKIRRCYKPDNFGQLKSAEVHHFSDASTVGYAQCSYLRLENKENRIHCSFITGKARVCPLKQVTVPRLELNAAVVSVKVSALLRNELENIDYKETFWTDSKVVLGYIANDARRFHVFVANRIQKIRDHSSPSQWRHVKTNENPADCGSRGISADELVNESLWLNGPGLLWQKGDVNLSNESIPIVSSEDPEVKRVEVFATQNSKDKFELHRLEHISNWYRAKRAIAACLKLKSRLHKPTINKVTTPITVADLDHAEKTILRLVQNDVFTEELKILQSLNINDSDIGRDRARKRNDFLKRTSCLYRLDPFVDTDGIIRVGGRIRRGNFPYNFKHPIILPRKHHITDLIIHFCHEKAAHQGRGMTINEIRASGFWVIGCTSAVSQLLSKCVTCRKLYGRVKEQKMADLPEDRLQSAPPFTYCGVDIFGPWLIKEGRSEKKRYGVLFTCLASRAVHIETTTSLSTDSFINSLRRFISIRGPIRLLRSDRGTNFVGAQTELDDAMKQMDLKHVSRFLLKEGCDGFEFKMNVPSASHAGGVWERQIRSVRRVLTSLMNQANSQLTDESLRTLMYEAAAMVNSRPLTVENLNDATSLEPLTPNHLLTLKSKVILPPPGVFESSDVYSRKQWRRVQQFANEFWSRWRKEFLQNLQSRQKWVRHFPEFKIGDIVIIKDDNLQRNKWRLARVQEVFPSEDGHIRKVKLLVGDPSLDNHGKRLNSKRFIERPIQKLVLLVSEPENRDIPAKEP